jgi:hypothetical protein
MLCIQGRDDIAHFTADRKTRTLHKKREECGTLKSKHGQLDFTFNGGVIR